MRSPRSNTPLFFLAGLLGVAGALIASNIIFIGRLLDLWQSFTTACFQSAHFVVQALSLNGFGHLAAIVCLSLGIFWSGVFTLRQTRQTRLLKQSLKARGQQISDARVWAVTDTQCFAFTLGSLQPEVFLSSGLLAALDADEQAAVIAHETAHVHAYDTTRLFFWSCLSRLLFFLPVIHRFIQRVRLQQELDADIQAAAATSPKILGRALLKVWQGQRHAQRLPATAVGFANFEQRIRHLLGERGTQTFARTQGLWAASLTSLLLLFSVYTAPVQPILAAAYTEELQVPNCEPTSLLSEPLESVGLSQQPAATTSPMSEAGQ